jgi:hypothetical protein
MAVLIGIFLYRVHKQPADSTTPGAAASAQGQVEASVKSLEEINQELSAQMKELQEKLRLTSEERDRLKKDKAQLLYMVEKLQQQSVKSSAAGREGSVSGRVVHSWLVRIAELKNAKISETAVSRDEYVKEINEVVRGLKEDFAEDTFIMGIGYAKTSSRAKSDISAAQKKLDDIITYLRAYDYGAD